MRKPRVPGRKRAKAASRPIALRNAAGGDAELQLGDVIGVSRVLYEHYGVYCGNNEVIHYTSAPRRRLKEDRTLLIRRTNIRHFLIKQKRLFILDCSDPRNPKKTDPIIISSTRAILTTWFYQDDIDKDFHLYSAEETISRAESQLGRGEWNLIVNNCEHFAVWCKTGLYKSYQVDAVLKHFKRFFFTAR